MDFKSKENFSSSSINNLSSSSIFSPSSKTKTITKYSSKANTSAKKSTIAEALVKIFLKFEINYAFGVSGGGISPIWATLAQSPIDVFHFRHETGAAFAAIESYFANNRPVLVFTTTGPGITNALTGLLAARGEGAKVILISGYTSLANRGRWACQETSPYTMPTEGIFTSGPLFHYATILESQEQIPEMTRRLAQGLTKPGGFVAHISVPTAIQTQPVAKVSLTPINFFRSLTTVEPNTLKQYAQWLIEDSFVVWIGFGARLASEPIRQLVEKTGAAIMCSPRAKGIFPETHPQFIGVTGLAGHDSVLEYMKQYSPERILVLGTRLGEPTSFWNLEMIPKRGFLHVDIDPEVPGVAYYSIETHSIQSEIGTFVKGLLEYLPDKSQDTYKCTFPQPKLPSVSISTTDLVRPSILMNLIQKQIVDNSEAIIMADAGNSFAWATHLLQFNQPNRYRISTGVGAMGHATTGIVGAALGSNSKAVAIVGDGSMLMQCEISTAVRFGIPAVWIVLNDSRYNMCAQGMKMRGFSGVDTKIPQTNFVQMAKAMGAEGISVHKESELEIALKTAMNYSTPFVVDVMIDPTEQAPIAGRIQSLKAQS